MLRSAPHLFFGKKGRVPGGKRERFILPCDYWHRAWDLHHTHVKVSEFIFTGQFSSSHSAQSRMTPPLYPLAIPTPQDLNQPDFYFSFLFLTFSFLWSWKSEWKDKRKELTEELNMETCNLSNQHEELSDMKKFWQGDLYRLQYNASDILCVSPWVVSGGPHSTWTPRCHSWPCLPHSLISHSWTSLTAHFPWRCSTRTKRGNPNHCLFLHMAFFTCLNFQSRRKAQIIKLYSGNLSLNCGNLPLLCLTCSYP